MFLRSWDSAVILCFVVRYFVYTIFAIILMWKRELVFVFMVSREYCRALPYGALGLSAFCDCVISRSYSFTIFDPANLSYGKRL